MLSRRLAVGKGGKYVGEERTGRGGSFDFALYHGPARA
jgi:hypothetical protein